MALGAKFFRLIRIHVSEIGPNHPLRKLASGRRLPRVVLLSLDGKSVKKLEGRISATRLFSAMSSIVRKDFKRSLGSFVSKARKLLNLLDALSGDRRKLEIRKAQALAKNRTSLLKSLKKKERALTAREEEARRKLRLLLSWTVPLGAEAGGEEKGCNKTRREEP